jgi:hypothetical protein
MLYTLGNLRPWRPVPARGLFYTAVETVPLVAADCGGVDPQLDFFVGEREELGDFAKLPRMSSRNGSLRSWC